MTVLTSIPTPATPRTLRIHGAPAPRLAPILTGVVWTGCLAAGIAGLLLPYRPPALPAIQPVTIQAELLNVEVTRDPSASADAPPPQAPELFPTPPAAPDVTAAPAAAPLTAVAEPLPAVAFALPVEGPTRKVEPAQASVGTPSPSADTPAEAPRAPASAPQRLTYGQGEGAQPAPDYPREAIAAGEQGVVGIQFTVGEDGRVRGAQVVAPCRFSRLNQSALLAVRDRWRFHPGMPRTYEVSIRFQFNR